MRGYAPFLIFLIAMLALCQTVEGFDAVMKDEVIKVEYPNRDCVKGTCRVTYPEPEIRYTKIDPDTFIWVEQVERGYARVCWNVSDKYKDKLIPMSKLGYTIELVYKPNTKYCSDYPLDGTDYFKLGEQSTELVIHLNDTGLDGDIYYLDDGTPGYVEQQGVGAGYVGNWLRNVSNNWWNYTYRLFYSFNTTTIPDTATVTNATWYFKTLADDAGIGLIELHSFDIGNDLDIGDWHLFTNETNETLAIGQKSDGSANMSETQGLMLNRSYYNPSAVAWFRAYGLNTSRINVTGVTTYGLRHRDESEISGSPDISNRWRLYISEQGNAQPYMVVYYTEGGDSVAPTITAITSNGTETVNDTWALFNYTCDEDIGIDPLIDINGTNYTATSYVNATTNSYFYYNHTGLSLNTTYCALYAYCADGSGNLGVSTETICRNTNESMVFPSPDLIVPPVDWIAPNTNGSETINVTYIVWNISVGETASGFIDINGTNQTATCEGSDANSYCWYNQTGLVTNATHCGIGWGADNSSNWNRTVSEVCRNIEYNIFTEVAIATVCAVEPLLWFLPGDIEIGWRFDC